MYFKTGLDPPFKASNPVLFFKMLIDPKQTTQEENRVLTLIAEVKALLRREVSQNQRELRALQQLAYRVVKRKGDLKHQEIYLRCFLEQLKA